MNFSKSLASPKEHVAWSYPGGALDQTLSFSHPLEVQEIFSQPIIKEVRNVKGNLGL